MMNTAGSWQTRECEYVRLQSMGSAYSHVLALRFSLYSHILTTTLVSACPLYLSPLPCLPLSPSTLSLPLPPLPRPRLCLRITPVCIRKCRMNTCPSICLSCVCPLSILLSVFLSHFPCIGLFDFLRPPAWPLDFLTRGTASRHVDKRQKSAAHVKPSAAFHGHSKIS